MLKLLLAALLVFAQPHAKKANNDEIYEEQMRTVFRNHLDPNYVDDCTISYDCFKKFQSTLYESGHIVNQLDSRNSHSMDHTHYHVCSEDPSCKYKFDKLNRQLDNLHINREWDDEKGTYTLDFDRKITSVVTFPKKMKQEEVLLELWKAAKPVDYDQELPVIGSFFRLPSLQEAKAALRESKYVKYLNGRPIFTDFKDFKKTHQLDSTGYDSKQPYNEMRNVASDIKFLAKKKSKKKKRDL